MVRDHGAYHLQIDDIRDCFPSARLKQTIECQHREFHQPELRNLTELIIRGHEGRGEEDTGLGQGSPYSPVAMEAYLHSFDTRARTQGIEERYFSSRYVDNLTWLVRSTSQGNEILRLADETLNQIGFALKGEGGCIDLRDPQHDTALLGLVPRWRDGQFKFTFSSIRHGKA